ncbi:hypothetical protein AY599_12375 [Leptolyngbya valderiana BDU 20041]|nr:hypothetical protein AY599_12375 [Leptolyngbya valderiana BDU 20041]PPT04896.1 Chemotaxis protein methyltransferase CheR [Geitlerinema sp. FC II]
MDNIPTETSFFRDFQVFEALRQSIFPELLRRHRLDRQLNLWCAACSSGQEAYSLAILLRDYFPLLANEWNLTILASDVSEAMLAKARSGTYTDLEVRRRLPPKFLRRYFQKQGSQWSVSDDIRLMVQFRQIDLLKPLPSLPEMDVILLRNVLIYFDRAIQAEILDKMHRVLAPDGYLLLGATETPLRCDTVFKPVSVDRTVLFQLRPPDDADGGRSRHTGN